MKWWMIFFCKRNNDSRACIGAGKCTDAAGIRPGIKSAGLYNSFAAIENGHIDRDTEDSIKSWLVAALFKFRFDEHEV